MLEVFRKNFTKEILLPESQLSNFFSIVQPSIKNSVNIGENEYKKVEKYIPAELYAKLYLDYNDLNYVLADIRFIYGDVEINPLDSKRQVEVLSRNTIKESKLINMFVKSGFMLDQKNNRLILANDDKIYEFLTNDMDSYMKNFEVLATDNFKAKEVRSTSAVNLGVRVENNLLDIDFSSLDFDPAELQEIMKQYKLKKRYHRLKDGSFVNLEDNDTIKFIESVTEDIDVDYGQIKNNTLQLPMYRALYLDKILEKNSFIHVTKDESYKNLVENIDVKEIEGNISQIKVNQNGYVAISVIDTSYKTVVVMYDEKGNELFRRFFRSTRVEDISISNDSKYLAIAEVDTSGTIIKSNIEIISTEAAKTDSENSVVKRIEGTNNDLITKIKYQEKNKLVCMYTDRIDVIKEDGSTENISKNEDKKISFMDINMQNNIVTVEEQSSGLFTADSVVTIKNTENKNEATYKIESVAKEIYTNNNVIGINLGTEIEFINPNGWLIKRYSGKQEITKITLSNAIAGIIYRDRVEIITL